jgi:ribosomal protein S18 acetylase RimI-like enzyme
VVLETTRVLSDIDKERIESAALRAWPALEDVPLESWRLRYSEGFTGRANSVQTPPGSSASISSRVAEAEQWYAARGIPCAFRLTPFSEPGLDGFLATQDFKRVKPTNVLWSEAESLAAPGLSERLQFASLDHWTQVFASLSGLSGGPPPALRRIVATISVPTLLGVLMDESNAQPVACGLAVAEGDFVGLFDLVVERNARRQGHGTELVQQLIGWGIDRGATRAYLQVQGDNFRASNLYQKLGFDSAYQYWYRARTT